MTLVEEFMADLKGLISDVGGSLTEEQQKELDEMAKRFKETKGGK